VRLERVELFVVRLPLKRAYETSGARETHMTRVLCRAESEGAVGWGESVAGELPWYSGETPRTVLYALEEFILPELFKTDLARPEDVQRVLAWIREHRMAKATIEMAKAREETALRSPRRAARSHPLRRRHRDPAQHRRTYGNDQP